MSVIIMESILSCGLIDVASERHYKYRSHDNVQN